LIDLDSYARIIVRVGVALKAGQNLLIVCNEGNQDLARAVGVAAYRAGAGYVETRIEDNHLTRARIEHQEGGQLEYVPAWVIGQDYEMLSEDWARVRIDSTEQMDILESVDSEKLGALTRASRRVHRTYMRAMMRHAHAWCVVCSPGPEWARKVLGPEGTTQQLWEVLKPILRLDETDPAAAWRRDGDTLLERGRRLTAMGLDRLRFVDDGTDLTVGLMTTCQWVGGPEILADGRWTMPNIPTEEVFTSPDWRRTEGKVRCTRPVKVMETLVAGAWFRFQEGRVVDAGADTGSDVLEAFLSTDEQARYLGEIALVDIQSPVARSGLTFSSILYDENASCHFALGSGYPGCLTNASSLNGDKALMEAGCNVSLAHTDFMISSPGTRVVGIGRDGREIPIMESGRFIA
jgi:aminopeptidase